MTGVLARWLLGYLLVGLVLLVAHTILDDCREETSQPVRRPKKRDDVMSKLTEQQKQELALLAGLPDGNIDTSDIPEQTDWEDAQRGKFFETSSNSC